MSAESFVSFAREHGLRLEYAEPDGRIHRVPTTEHPRKRNGTYRYIGDWGWVCNWEIDGAAVVWRADRAQHAMPAPQRPIRPAVTALMAEERAKRLQAAQRAAEIVGACQVMSHPYLERKGFKTQAGLVYEDGRLVVPMRHWANYRQLQSVQFINDAGEKKFLPGGAAQDAVYVIGPHGAPETWLTEGVATAYSVQAALRLLHRPARVMVCFSAGNLARVGEQLTGFVRVVGDNDASRAGEESARKTGHPWVMPDAVGLDANDLHRLRGLGALVDLLRGVL